MGQSGIKRPNNCFRCWHCRRIDGLSSCCICMANVSKGVKPDLILEPYQGDCKAFYDKKLEEYIFPEIGGSDDRD